ncbi:MAG: PEGA domain-containing protein [Kofleriaceae bacterium]
MRWALVAGIALSVCIGATAEAGRKVDVDSDPTGASVYLNDVDSGAACNSTPCTIDVPVGTTTIIIRKDGYAPEITEITVPKRGRVKPFKVSLRSEVGTLVVTDPALKGGRIFVDDIDKGPVPQHLDIPAGPHHVQVLVRGKPVADDIINLDADSEHELKASSSSSAPVPPQVADSTLRTGGFENDGDGDGEAKPNSVVAHQAAEPESSEPREPYLFVGADFDVGFRQFKYDNAQNGLAATESESGQAMLGPAVELWPMILMGSHHLRGLSLFGKVEFGLNHQPVLDSANAPVGPTTFWGNIEAGLRHRWHVGDDSSVAIEGGYVRDQLQFMAASKALLLKVPYADYRSIKLGVRASTMVGSLEPFLEVEGRIVLSGGDLGDRFMSHDITGGHAAVGASITAGPVYLRAQAAITLYSWALTSSGPTQPGGTADGASDRIEVLSFVVGLAH